jgi:DNA-binding cell septation regulator SpoVG
MNITEVRIRLKQRDDSKIRAIASLTIDNCFVVHDIKVIEGNEGLFIAMPSRKTPEGEYKDIPPKHRDEGNAMHAYTRRVRKNESSAIVETINIFLISCREKIARTLPVRNAVFRIA